MGMHIAQVKAGGRVAQGGGPGVIGQSLDLVLGDPLADNMQTPQGVQGGSIVLLRCLLQQAERLLGVWRAALGFKQQAGKVELSPGMAQGGSIAQIQAGLCRVRGLAPALAGQQAQAVPGSGLVLRGRLLVPVQRLFGLQARQLAVGAEHSQVVLRCANTCGGRVAVPLLGQRSVRGGALAQGVHQAEVELGLMVLLFCGALVGGQALGVIRCCIGCFGLQQREPVLGASMALCGGALKQTQCHHRVCWCALASAEHGRKSILGRGIAQVGGHSVALGCLGQVLHHALA